MITLLQAVRGRGNAIQRQLHSPSLYKPLHVDFYFDTVSPYSWPAFEVLCRYRDRWDLTITWKPVFMGGLVKAAENNYLEQATNKMSYNFMDVETRTANFFGIPLKMKADPVRLIAMVGSLQAQRFVTSVLQNYPHHMESVCREFWVRSWGEDQDVNTAEDWRLIAASAGMNSEEVEICLQAVGTGAVKDSLKQVTEEAVDRGAFGVPTMFFHEDGENENMIWGSDRFEMVAHLYGKPWLGPKPEK